MNRSMKKGWVLIVLSLVMWSCDLEIEGTDSVILPEEEGTFNGVADVDGSVNTLYNDIQGWTGDQANLYALQTVTTDELLVPTRGTDWGDNGVWRTLHTHTWTPTHDYVRNVWNNHNGAILKASEVIDPLSGANDSQLALARFARAWNMRIILDFYGQVPFREPTQAAGTAPTVLTRQEAYDLIVEDFTFAAANLPAAGSRADKFRPDQATAKFFLAKTILNSEVYTGTAGNLNQVITLVDEIEAEGYGFDSSFGYFELFMPANIGNSEIIWSANAGTANRFWNGLHYNQAHTGNGGGGWNGFTTLAETFDAFEGPANDNSVGAGQEERRGYVQTAATANDENQGFGFGFQLGQMVNAAGEPISDRQGNPLAFTRELPGLVGNNEVTGIRVLKYTPAVDAFYNGVVMARWADAYLMRAEARLRTGGNITAEVNALRTLRGASELANVGESELEAERLRELYTEGYRREDMIRFGTYTRDWEFKESAAVGDVNKNLFPIPSDAILSNPNLVQNPGY